MALAPFFSRRAACAPCSTTPLFDVPDPFDMMVTLFDNAPASSFVRDATAVANTNVDWKETPTEHLFRIDLPGVRKEDVKVEIEGDRTLSVSGQRVKEEVMKGDTWHRVERTSGMFMRKFRLPETVDLEHIQAKMDNGVLTVVVPKMEQKHTQPRQIEVGGQEGGEHQRTAAQAQEPAQT